MQRSGQRDTGMSDARPLPPSAVPPSLRGYYLARPGLPRPVQLAAPACASPGCRPVRPSRDGRSRTACMTSTRWLFALIAESRRRSGAVPRPVAGRPVVGAGADTRRGNRRWLPRHGPAARRRSANAATGRRGTLSRCATRSTRTLFARCRTRDARSGCTGSGTTAGTRFQAADGEAASGDAGATPSGGTPSDSAHRPPSGTGN